MCELVKKYQKTKCNKTYTKIFNKYYPDLKAFLSSKFKVNSHIIEDIALMSFEQARIKIDSYDSERPFKTWFYTLSKRIGIRTIEKENIYFSACFENGEDDSQKSQSNNLAKKLLEQEHPHESEANPLLSKIKVKTEGKDHLLDAYDSVINEIHNLKGDIKNIFIDSYLNNMTFEKIMSKYNLTESQVKLKLFTGRKDIRKIFHERRVDEIKRSLNVEELKIPKALNELIQKRLKYNGELVVSKRGRGYSYKYIFVNKKVNLKAIHNHVESHNKKVNKEIVEYSESIKMKEDSTYAKSYFDSQIKKLEKEGYQIEEEESIKAKDLDYNVTVKGIKTRNRSGNSKSNCKLMKVDRIKTSYPDKLQQLKVKESRCDYLSLSVVEKTEITKIEIK